MTETLPHWQSIYEHAEWGRTVEPYPYEIARSWPKGAHGIHVPPELLDEWNALPEAEQKRLFLSSLRRKAND